DLNCGGLPHREDPAAVYDAEARAARGHVWAGGQYRREAQARTGVHLQRYAAGAERGQERGRIQRGRRSGRRAGRRYVERRGVVMAGANGKVKPAALVKLKPGEERVEIDFSDLS